MNRGCRREIIRGGSERTFPQIRERGRSLCCPKEKGIWGRGETLGPWLEHGALWESGCSRPERRIWEQRPVLLLDLGCVLRVAGTPHGWRRDRPCRMLSLRAAETRPGLDQVLTRAAT